jgi:molecular chaperone GrpE
MNMSEHDATDADTSAGDSSETADQGSTGDEGAGADRVEEALENIAAEPEADLDDALDEILDEKDVEPTESLVEHVTDSDPETVAAELAAFRDRVETLEDTLQERTEEVADLESRLKRKQADFQNYKKRQKERMEEEKMRATEDLVRRLLDVRDNLERALEQDEDADIRGGVESTLRQFDEQLERENVEPIEPDPGDETDPTRHETLATVASELPEGTVARIHRPGYEMAGKVVRPAQVAVSDGSQAGTESDADESTTGGESGEAADGSDGTANDEDEASAGE